jgi:hypothetical protein
VEYADLAVHGVPHVGFRAERRSGGVVAVETGGQPHDADEIRGILAAYGAREHAPTDAAGDASSDEQRTRAEGGAGVELVEEQLRARTRPVQTGEVETIRREHVRIDPHRDASVDER